MFIVTFIIDIDRLTTSKLIVPYLLTKRVIVCIPMIVTIEDIDIVNTHLKNRY